MEHQLIPSTAAGAAFVELAEKHASDADEGVAERDRAGAFPVDLVDAMKESGFLRSLVPEQRGGAGVSSLRDAAIGLGRLGRVDPSLAIACNMHFATTYVAARVARKVHEGGVPDDEAGVDAFLDLLGQGFLALANHTESGTDIVHPQVTAHPVEGGWRLDGRKTFSTLSPVADVMMVSCRLAREGPDDIGTAVVFRGTEGQQILDSWDALGMRASGSHDIVYDGCFVPDDLILLEGRWGEPNPLTLVNAAAGGIGLLGVFVGIAEAARVIARGWATTRRRPPDGPLVAARPGIQHAMAELDLAVASCRAHLDWVGRRIDDDLSAPVETMTMDRLHALNSQFQLAKLAINRSAIDAVDRALQISGGAGYMTANPLSRLYRDVRAGPFMQQYSPNEAYLYIGRMALGLDPVTDL